MDALVVGGDEVVATLAGGVLLDLVVVALLGLMAGSDGCGEGLFARVEVLQSVLFFDGGFVVFEVDVGGDAVGNLLDLGQFFAFWSGVALLFESFLGGLHHTV